MANHNWRSARAAQLVEDLNRRGAAFIRNFDRQEPRMVEIAREFDGIAAEVKKIIDIGEKVTMFGTVMSAAGLGATVLGLIAAPFTGGTSMFVSAGVRAAVVGGTMFITAKVMQCLRESGSAKDLERRGNEFMMIAQPFDEELKEIKAMAKQLKEEAAKCYLMEKFRRVEDALRLVDDTLGAIEEAIAFIKSLVQLIRKLLQHTSTDDEEHELSDKIIKSSEQFWKIINRFREVKENLQGFNADSSAI